MLSWTVEIVALGHPAYLGSKISKQTLKTMVRIANEIEMIKMYKPAIGMIHIIPMPKNNHFVQGKANMKETTCQFIRREG